MGIKMLPQERAAAGFFDAGTAADLIRRAAFTRSAALNAFSIAAVPFYDDKGLRPLDPAQGEFPLETPVQF